VLNLLHFRRAYWPYDRLVELAADKHGFVRTEDAKEAGVRPDYLRRLAMKGRLERRAQGLYRLTALPVGPLDEYHEAVLAARGEGVVAGDAALALWGLTDVNPREIEVILPPANGFAGPKTAGSGSARGVSTETRSTRSTGFPCSPRRPPSRRRSRTGLKAT